MTYSTALNDAIPTILFGAFDRHNFGDLLFPHVTARLVGRSDLVFAGLAQRDLRAHGGHAVKAIARLVAEWSDRPVNIIHVGGELLTCNAWQAAAMLLPPEEAKDTIARYDTRPRAALAWAHRQLGIPALAPYSISRRLFPLAQKIIYNAVGGVDLDRCDPAFRTEVLMNLTGADAIGVRDRQTAAQLQAAGIAHCLLPDPAVMVAELFGAVIRERMQQGELAQLRLAFPHGYVAVQFSADFVMGLGADDPLAQIAVQLDQLVRESGLGVVFFRAGAAPWHDELDCYTRVVAYMRSASVRVFRSLDIWDIGALIAGSRCYVGSSLHGRIVAMAFAVPRMNVRHPAYAGRTTKHTAYADTWDRENKPATVDLHGIAEGVQHALQSDAGMLRRTAAQLVQDYRQGFRELCLGLT